MYAGEHTAGTEFVIGPLFVAHGASAGALIWGLLVGNLLAVLSWAFLTAPIATKLRLTLYYVLEKICGTKLTLAYNLVNALMFCFLAGAMIAVSATAVGIPFGLAMPSLNDWLPNSIGWIDTLGVDPQYQRQGIGTTLFNALIKNFKQTGREKSNNIKDSNKTKIEGVNDVYTLVNWNDWDLVQFYNKMGFKKGDMLNLKLKIR